MHPSSRSKIAFTVPDCPLYQFVYYLLDTAIAQIQCTYLLMHRVIPHELRDRVFVYLYDLLITSATFDDHIVLLKEVTGLLVAAGLTIKVEKSKFCLKQLKYLGSENSRSNKIFLGSQNLSLSSWKRHWLQPQSWLIWISLNTSIFSMVLVPRKSSIKSH